MVVFKTTRHVIYGVHFGSKLSRMLDYRGYPGEDNGFSKGGFRKQKHDMETAVAEFVAWKKNQAKSE